MNIYHFIDSTLGNTRVLCLTTTLTVAIKLYITWHLLKNNPKNRSSLRPWLILLIFLSSTILTEASWIAKLLQEIYPTYFNYQYILLFIRVAWMFYVIQAQALTLFVESLLEKQFNFSCMRISSFILSAFLGAYYLYIAVAHVGIVEKQARIELSEYLMFDLTFLYMLILIGYILAKSIKKMQANQLPKILHKQLQIFISYLLIPNIIIECMVLTPFLRISSSFDWLTNNYSFLTTSMLFSGYTAYYAAKTMIGLRFLNLAPHVQTNKRFDFINDFKMVLEQLGHITDTKELRHLTYTFFKEAFGISPEYLSLAIRPDRLTYQNISAKQSHENVIEQFLNYHDNLECPISQFLREKKILIHDEIDFNFYYNLFNTTEDIMNFIKTIDADIFLPIFEKHTITGYIIVKRHARDQKFYTNIERDEMLVYASYLGNIITLLNHKNLQTILAQEKELREELYNKHQEITLYKESIRSFLRTSKERKIGIVFYKNAKLKWGNQAAQELIKINIMSQNDGHPTKKTLRQIGRFVQEYKQPQSATIKDLKGEQLICTGFLNIDGTHVIILIYYPEIADIVKHQVDLLKDPSKWDYLLYLETTQTGQLINRLIPSSSESLLNFKIDLLKIALTAKAVLLELPEKDLWQVINIIQHISLRQNFESILLESPEKRDEVAINLFGINPIFSKHENQSLLEKLHAGTLFIKNIHYLSFKTQKNLTNVIKYGFFTICRGTTRIFSDVRILCSTDQNLETMVSEGTFYEPLYLELKRTSLSMPSLLTLPEHELTDLTNALSEQAVKDQPLKNLFALSTAEKTKLAHKRPVSLYELKTKIHQILDKKSTKTSGQELNFEAAHSITDPELENVKGLGKQALKDPNIMKLLCKKFKKQTEIAKFLGVHRSSVSRKLRTIKDEHREKVL